MNILHLNKMITSAIPYEDDKYENDLDPALDEYRISKYSPNTLTINDVYAVVLVIKGEPEYGDWHWIVKLKNGRFAYIWGGCSITGWEVGKSDIYIADTAMEAINFADQHTRLEFEEMINKLIRRKK
jgi:hypothetical protein